MKKQRFSNVNAGGIMLLMIAALLCLAIFGALSVSSAYADLRLADKMTAATASYYQADAAAQRTIAQVDELIAQAAQSQGDTEYLVEITQGAQDLGLEVVEEEGALLLRFTAPMDDRQQLQVVLYTDFDSKTYAVTQYRVVRTQEEDYSEKPMDLWDGTLPG